MSEAVAAGGSADSKLNHGILAGLTYHEVSPEAPKYLYSISAEQFRSHAGVVKKFATENALLENQYLISFDDGHVSQYSQAFPILEEWGIKATFFITPAWTENREGYMSWKQLAELAKYGHAVQSHGWSHELLTHCEPQLLQAELCRAKKELEDHLGTGVDSISAPGGRWNDKVLAKCAEVGYQRVLTSDPWMSPGKRFGVEVAGRWMVTRNMVSEDIYSRLTRRGSKLALLKLNHMAKAALRKAIGDEQYQSLWRALAGKKDSMEIRKQWKAGEERGIKS
jgi:peptidoglycan/xylan/chitin deacetylase (PgdA/CDA1 family)